MVGDAANGFRVDGEPLGFYHFTGFDSGAHRIMAIKNAGGNAAVQELIGWYERETQFDDRDPASAWPWAFGCFSDGTRIEPHQRWIYREARDLHTAFPDPYDAKPGKLTFLEWCGTEGRIRFPQFFGKTAGEAPPLPSRPRARVTFTMGLKLFVLLFAPRAGRPLRERLVRTLKTEGVGGITRRLRGSHSG
jgi:hypothetical protein